MTTPLEVHALDGDGAGFSLVVSRDEDVHLTALSYDIGLAELGLSPGLLQEAAPGEEGRPLPAEQVIFENVISEGAETGWAMRDARPPRVDAFRIQVASPVDCAELGGCRVDDLPCQVPCNAPSVPDGPLPPTPPEPPLPLDQRPCPAGWGEEALEGGFICTLPAYPGTPCDPGSDYATDLPSGRAIVYVAPGGTGDGSAAAPLGTIADALLAAQPGEVVALAKGAYEEPVEVPAGATIVGACPEETVIVSTSTETPALVVLGDATVENLRVSGAVRSVEGRTELIDLVIDGGEIGWHLAAGAVGVGTRLLVEGVVRAGLVVDGGVVRLEHALVRQVLPAPDGLSGMGLHVLNGGGVQASRSIVEDTHTFGIFVTRGGTATVTDSLVRRTAPRPQDEEDGTGIAVFEGSIVSAERLLIQESHDRGVMIQHSGTRASLFDVMVLDTLPEQKQNDSGRGMDVRKEAVVELARVAIERCSTSGLEVAENAELMVEDLTIEDVGPTPRDQRRGQGLLITTGAIVGVKRAAIAATHVSGVSIRDDDAPVTLEDVQVRGTVKAPEDSLNTFGGIWTNGRAVEIRRATVEDAEAVGVRVVGNGQVDVTDLAVSGGSFAGVRITDAASAMMQRVMVSGVEGDNFQTDEQAEAELSDVMLLGSSSRPARTGSGITVSSASTARVIRFVIGDNDAFGARIELASTLVLSDGEIFGSQIGVLVGRSGHDLSLLTSRVRYRDNQKAIDGVP